MRRRGPGLIGVAARTAVVAGTATAVSGKVAQKQANKAADQAAQQQAQAEAQQVAAEPAEDPQVAKLKELASLHSQGVLTDEEFAAAKAKLLGI